MTLFDIHLDAALLHHPILAIIGAITLTAAISVATAWIVTRLVDDGEGR